MCLVSRSTWDHKGDGFSGVLTKFLARFANRKIVLVGHDANFVHESNLFLVVAIESITAGVDVREEAKDEVRRDRLRRFGGGRSRRHDARNLSIEVLSRREKELSTSPGNLA